MHTYAKNIMLEVIAAILLGIGSVISVAAYVGKKPEHPESSPSDKAYLLFNFKDPDDGSFEKAHPNKEERLAQLKTMRYQPDEGKLPFLDTVIALLENAAHRANQDLDDIKTYFRVHEALKNNGKRR